MKESSKHEWEIWASGGLPGTIAGGRGDAGGCAIGRDGAVSGLVTDPQSAVLRGAVVKLIDNSTNAERETVTNETGRYIFNSVPLGSYDLTVTQPVSGWPESNRRP